MGRPRSLASLKVGRVLRTRRRPKESSQLDQRTDGSESHPYPENKKGVLTDALFIFQPDGHQGLLSSLYSYWQASQVPPLRMASIEQAFFSASVYVGLSALAGVGAFSTVAFSMFEAPRVRR